MQSQQLTAEAIEIILLNAHLSDRGDIIYILKDLRDNYGVDIGVKLNRKTYEIKTAYEELIQLAKQQNTDASLVEEAEVINQDFSNFDGIDSETMMSMEQGWSAANPLTCDPCNYQYCELPQPEYTVQQAVNSVADVVQCLVNRMFKDARRVWALIPTSWVETCKQLLKSYKDKLQKTCNSFAEMVKVSKAVDRFIV